MAGIDYIADYLQRFGFNRDQYKATEALALGAASFTPLEMARGYAVFDNGGYLIDPFIIERIEDVNGNEIYLVMIFLLFIVNRQSLILLKNLKRKKQPFLKKPQVMMILQIFK